MNLSAPFVRRPVATILLTIGLALAGIAAFFMLAVAPLPQVDFPVISVSANLPGASPDTMATSVATPLERRLGVIAGVNEMTSNSGNGSTRISLQFDLNRKIDSAAREVQAAINASRGDLPATLRSNPTYRKANPSAAPVVILALTSPTRSPGQVYDAVSNIVQQKIAQVQGVGDVELGGGSLPAVRVDLLPFALSRYGVSSEDVRAALQASSANRPKGTIEGAGRQLQIYTGTGSADKKRPTAVDYRGLVVAWRNGAAIRLADIAEVSDSVENINTLGLFNGEPAVIVLVTLQPGANAIETVDQVRAMLPELQAQLPSDIKLQVATDRTHSIRSSLHEVEVTLMIAIVLVVLVVSAFLRSVRATIIPAVATIVSLLGTFGVMYLLGFSLNNLSLMALTVATGFVVDDAIVVLENTSRHIEAGMDRFKAALLGAREVGFTVLSISLSLVAVFIPLLFMGGQVGRLFREFAVTLSAAVLISLVISLTTTPMMCAWLLRPDAHEKKPGPVSRFFERSFAWMQRAYEHSLDWALAAQWLVLLILALVIGLNVYLFVMVPKGFFPQQDTGQIQGGLRADQSISFQAMQEKLRQLVNIIRADPAVDTVVGFTGGGRAGGGFLFVNLKRAADRTDKGQAVIARLRPQLAQVTGVSLFLNPVQDLRMGGRQSNSTYQYTLKSDNIDDLRNWATRLAEAMKRQPALVDVDTDQQENGVEVFVEVDKDSAVAAGHQLARRGQRAVQRLRPAPGGDDLRRAEPVPRDPGRRAAVHAQPRGAQGHLRAGARQQGHHRHAAQFDGERHIDNREHEHFRQPRAARPGDGPGREQLRRHDGAAVGHREVLAAADGQLGEPPGCRACHHHLLQPGGGPQPLGRPGCSAAGRGRDRPADQRARQLPGHGAGGAGFAEGAADADPRGAGRHLHRAGHLVREPGAPDHRALHAAIRRRGRRAGAADLQDGAVDHRAHRPVPVDRHREEKRDLDHRLRAGRGALARALALRCRARGLPAALPPHPHDHAGRRPGRAAAGDRLRRRRRAAPARWAFPSSAA